MRQQALVERYWSAGAMFDEPARVYRYLLWRYWSAAAGRQVALFVMLNPSTADEHVLDPTLRRCEHFARAWGYDGFEVVNLFALRSTDPKQLYVHAAPVGGLDGGANDYEIRRAAGHAAIVVCGWGKEKIANGRGATVVAMLSGVSSLHVLTRDKRTGQAWPGHPLYLKNETQPILWKP